MITTCAQKRYIPDLITDIMTPCLQVAAASVTAAVYRIATVDKLDFWADEQV